MTWFWLIAVLSSRKLDLPPFTITPYFHCTSTTTTSFIVLVASGNGTTFCLVNHFPTSSGSTANFINGLTFSLALTMNSMSIGIVWTNTSASFQATKSQYCSYLAYFHLELYLVIIRMIIFKLERIIFCFQANRLWSCATFSKDLSLQQKGHLIFKVPVPQQEQFTIPSDVAPLKGYERCKINPHLMAKKVHAPYLLPYFRDGIHIDKQLN